MSRIRSLHPSQWTEEDFVQCSPMARLLLLGLRNEADDHGVFEWRPLSLKLRVLPADNVEIDELLAELVGRGQIVRFEADGHSYGVCMAWGQTSRHPSYRYPEPPAGLQNLTDTGGSTHADSGSLTDTGGSTHADSGSLTDTGGSTHAVEESESESESEREGAPAPAGAALSLDFDLPGEWEEEARTARQSVDLAEVNLAAEWAKFRHHHAGKKHRDWRRRWFNWALNARVAPGESAAPNGRDAGPPAGPVEPEATARRETPPDWQRYPLKWRSAARRFVDGVWWPGDGPMPGETGCQMPGELMAWCIEQRALPAEPAKVANGGDAPVKPRRHRPPDPAQPAMKLPIAGGKAAAEPEAVKHKPKPGDRDPRTTPPPGKPWPGDSWEGRPPAREVG